MPPDKSLTPSHGSHHAPLSGWHALPAELRLKIYHHTWEPRKVIIYHGTKSKKGRKRKRTPTTTPGRSPDQLILRVHSRPPKTLRLNAESRVETLRHYIPFFQSTTLPGQAPNLAYLNPSLDFLILTFIPNFRGSCMTNLGVSYDRAAPSSQRFLDTVAAAQRLVLPNTSLESSFAWMMQEVEVEDAAGQQQPNNNNNNNNNGGGGRFAALQTIDSLGARIVRTAGGGIDWIVQSHRLCRIDGCTVPAEPHSGYPKVWQKHWKKSLHKDPGAKGDRGFIRGLMLFTSCEEYVGERDAAV